MIYLSLDTTQLELPVNDYKHEFYDLTGYFSESVRAELGRDELRRLLEAKSLKGKWGDVEFSFSKDELVSLKDFIISKVFAARAH